LRLAARPWWHGAVRGLLAGLHAVPLFVLALALLLVFANPEMLSWFPGYGLDQAEDESVGFGSRLTTYTWHLALPVVALAVSAL
ncbi:hypothetical protein KYD79_27810, partial [Escherichia coli]|nr:hypothetical protein [Escherichia coli]